ncbi:hypothetical protein ACEWY4_009391 [Coilia grayii]|uniref:Apolipoprotein M n=1 Tax=Coilia grayii TaxID=363190 RepID=A0ABD1K6B5_9TELE
MALLWTISVCGLFSLVLAAPPECEQLIKPVDLTDPTVFDGKWFVVAAIGQGNMKWQKYFEGMTSSSFEMSPVSEDGKIHVRWADRVEGKCLPGTLDVTVSGSKSSSMFEGVLHESEYLQTCPDCLLFTDTSTQDNVLSKYMFLSKRQGSLTEAELETLKKQAECLDVPLTVYTYEAADLCPY